MKVKEVRDILTNRLLAYEVDGKIVNKNDKRIKMWIRSGGRPLPAFTEKERRNYLRQVKKVTLKSTLHTTLSDGMVSKTIGKKVNSRLEDIMNVRLLLDFMHIKGINKIQFRLFDNSYTTLTINEVKDVYHELISHYMSMRYKKWALDGLINVSKDVDWDENLRRRFPHETKKEDLNGANSKSKTQ